MRLVGWDSCIRFDSLDPSWQTIEEAASSTRTELACEVDALLDYSGGLEEYHRDDPVATPGVEHFRWNVEQMILACRSVVYHDLDAAVTNLADCLLQIEIDSGLSEPQRAEFEELWSRLRQMTRMMTRMMIRMMIRL